MASHDKKTQHSDQRRVAIISIFAAIALILIKLAAGVASGSLGLYAEALHSATDLVAALLTLVAVMIAQRPPDKTHPWGHGRAEHLAALFEALMLIAAVGWIGFSAIRRLFTHNHNLEIHGWVIAAMIVVIVIDIWRTIVSHRAAMHHHSPALSSNALHFLSDLAGSLAVLVGLLLAKAGFDEGDSLAALVVVGIVGVSASRLFWDNLQVLMDVVPEGAERAATRAINNLDLPVTLRRIRIRRSAGIYLADVVIAAHSTDHISQGHALADAVEKAVIEVLPGSDVVVHVEPDELGRSVRDKITAAALMNRGVYEVHNVRVLKIDGVLEVSLHAKARPDLRLDSAHDLADSIERSVRDTVPEVRYVDVHIEPVDTETAEADVVKDTGLASSIQSIVLELSGHEPRDLRIRNVEDKIKVYVTVLADAATTLEQAHSLASDIEARISEELTSVDDVVIHTEPFHA